MTIASAAHLAGRAFHILFGERNKQHKNNLLIILAASFLITFCLPFFNDTAPAEIYTLSLQDALPISHTCMPLSWAVFI